MIARRAEDVFAELINFGPGSRWYTAVAREEHTPPGPIVAGTQISQFRDERGREAMTRYLVRELAPGRLLTLESVAARPESSIHYVLSEVPEGVRLTCSIAVQTGGLLKLVESRLRRDLDGKLAQTLATFRSAVEQP